MTMQTFDPARKCAKCGGPAPEAEFHNPIDEWTYEHEGKTVAVPAKPERISRKCARCGYRWDEAPLDAKPEPTIEVTVTGFGSLAEFIAKHPDAVSRALVGVLREKARVA